VIPKRKRIRLGNFNHQKGNLKWGHAGGTDGYTSLLTIYPELSLGIILMTNNGDHDDNTFCDIEKQIYQNFNP
jgi:hypothetical protein